MEANDVEEVIETVEDDEEITAPGEEEAEQVQRLPTPEARTLSEILDHRATHVPFWAWCPDWIKGRGREVGHSSCQPREGRGVPTVSFDFASSATRARL